MAQRRRGIAGARLEFILGGVKLGWAVGANINEVTQNASVEVLGNHEPEEIEPLGKTVSVSVQTVRILREPLSKQNILSSGSTADFINLPAMDALVYDKVGNQAVGKLFGLRISGRNISMQPRSLVLEDLSFDAVSYRENVDIQ